MRSWAGRLQHAGRAGKHRDEHNRGSARGRAAPGKYVAAVGGSADDLLARDAYRQGMFYMHNFGWGWWVVMSIGIVAFWALVIWAIVWLVRGAGRTVEQRAPSPLEDPKAVLQRRLATGEISIEDYRRLVEALDDQPRQPSIAA
jgi:putative membrane protein